ncbi:MerR family transcriptional regulator [Planococcus sp. CAU13]|uniref:MerR family transcriptional regulator n=1 Tax=Planococcus sp. CAU13 TaxID=1541197 RepID=UPI00052FE412|nr:MerR family transcriptional regulator [Planococcus sp. CAU13]
MTNRVRRSMPILPISIVMQLTDLTARQIRYYEEHGLISPARTDGNKRMFSLNDVDVLFEIKDFLDQGLNIAGIRKMFEMKNQPQNVLAEPKNLSDEDVRRIFREEMMPGNSFNRNGFRQGDLSRFYQ